MKSYLKSFGSMKLLLLFRLEGDMEFLEEDIDRIRIGDKIFLGEEFTESVAIPPATPFLFLAFILAFKSLALLAKVAIRSWSTLMRS